MAEVDVNVPGNWMARQLRLINDDSRELFPKTAGSVRSRSKFNSLYMVDYPDPPYGAIYQRIEDKKQLDFIQKNRETIADVLFGGTTREFGQMFEKWRVPEEFLDTDVAAPASPRSKTPRVLGKTALPRIQPNDCARPSGSVSARLPKKSSFSKSRTPRLPDRQVFNDTQPAGNWFQKSPHVDRAVIEEIMRLQQRKNLTEHTWKRSFKPDAKLSVEKWLQTASEQERKVALNFFTSLAASSQLGPTIDAPGSRLQQAINTLRRSKTSLSPTGPQDRDDISPSRLQYIHLLEPQERANRWQYTTWHHQPEYRQLDRVNNWSSHYTRPHAPPPRHFVIHPDWG
ncbi:uncharacterized protein LOC121383962 isoform X2 [Gigantopelta aegis]|uniref:uncharacterized protein LOC121383962 isoform X2 n=1 Tax=Gigantopelta aegis TaxID=1735272 RepID=UPI001B887A1B|nr:uncharacterized protein LOC121383962 isoform X2 [Gigantopelta aegis]